MNLNWSDEYKIGIEKIDRQHQYFFTLTNKLLKIVAKREQSHRELLLILNKLFSYTLRHFAIEEAMFDKSKYESAKHHILRHNEMRRKMRGYLRRINKPNANIDKLVTEIARHSVDWLHNHITVEDRLYSTYAHLLETKNQKCLPKKRRKSLILR